MKTSSFYLYSGQGRISIARIPARRATAGFKAYRALAPGAWLFNPKYRDYDTYRERYFREILAPLEPQKIWDDLHALADGHEPVLLCHEHLRKPGEWCHRRMVAEWFKQKLGVAVPELLFKIESLNIAQKSLFDVDG